MELQGVMICFSHMALLWVRHGQRHDVGLSYQYCRKPVAMSDLSTSGARGSVGARRSRWVESVGVTLRLGVVGRPALLVIGFDIV